MPTDFELGAKPSYKHMVLKYLTCTFHTNPYLS
jgi:hypothetical protein